MIEVANIHKSFGRQSVLKGVRLRVAGQEHVMLTGTSGCGKSTLLRLIAGLELPDKGAISLDGTVVAEDTKMRVSADKRSIGFVPQDLGLWNNLSVQQNILLGRKLYDSFYTNLLEASGLAAVERKLVGCLSSGERQRVALLRALVARPKILLMDEPFASLDLLRKREFYTAIERLVTEDCTLITVTHEPTDWMGLKPSRLLALEDGCIKDDILRDSHATQVESKILQAWQALGIQV